MTSEPVDFAREYFKRVDAKMDRILDAVSDMTLRFGSIEEQMLLLRKDFIRLEHRFDRFEDRLAKIEKRLDLVEA